MPYKPKGVEKLEKRFVHPKYYYAGIDMYIAAFCVNTKVMKEKNLPMPKGWNDLLDPRFKGLVTMPNPVASGTGFLQIASILQMYGAKEGKEDGWEFLKKLDKNIGQYIKSGSRPAKMTAAGEFAVGASFDFPVAEQKKQGFPVEFVFPVEGAGYEVEANALLKGAKNPKAAKRFLDWAITDNAMKEYAQVQVRRYPSRDSHPAGSAATVRDQTLSHGFRLAGQERRGHQEEMGEPLLKVIRRSRSSRLGQDDRESDIFFAMILYRYLNI